MRATRLPRLARTAKASPAKGRSALRGRRQTKGKRPAVQRGNVWFSMVAILVVFGSLLGIVVVQTFIVQNRVKWDSVNNELVEAREQNQRLRLQVIELEAPERILETAVTRLGMVRPEERTYVPGVDPDLVEVRLPPAGDPFGPGPLPEFLEAGDS